MACVRSLFGISLLLLSLVGAPAGAATLTVNNLADSGAGSLRDQIAAAAANDTIVFAPGVTGTILLSSLLSVTQSMTIQGPGVAVLTIDDCVDAGSVQHDTITAVPTL